MLLYKKIAQTLYAERDRFVLWVPVLLGLGIGVYFSLAVEPQIRWLAASLAALALVGWLVRRHFWPRIAAIAVFVMILGVLVAGLRTQAVDAPYLYSTMYFKAVQGRVDDMELREKDQKIFLSEVAIEGVRQETTPQRISIALRKPAPDLRVGDRIEVKAMLFPPPGPAMPGAYDFARSFYYDRLGGVGYTPYEPTIIEKVSVNTSEEWLNALRLRVAERIRASMSEENGPVATALMVGEMSAVPETLRDTMRDSGLYHVLSISGLHMSIAVGVIYVTIRLLLSLYMPLALRLPVKKIAASVGLLGAFCYLLLAGYPVPAVRSFVMVACVMLAILFDRRGISVFSLAWAALLILLFQPESLIGSSFQLSFAATLGIVVLYERFGHLLYKPDIGVLRMLRLYFIGLMATSLVATLATTPLVIYQFNRMTVWGVVANMLMVPLASFWIMPAAVLSFLAMPLGLEHWPLVWLEQGIGWMIRLARWFAALPYAAINLPPLTTWGILMVVAGGLWLCLWEKRWRLLGVPLILIGMSTIALHKPYDLVVNEEGNRAMLRLPDGRFLFLRGRPDSFESEIWLRAMGQDSALTVKDMPEMDCDKNRCIADAPGRKIIVGLRKDAADLCQPGAQIVVYENWLKDAACKEIPWPIDRKFLRANGAVAFRFEGDKIQADVTATSRGGRPWGARAYWPLYQSQTPAMMQHDQPQKDTP